MAQGSKLMAKFKNLPKELKNAACECQCVDCVDGDCSNCSQIDCNDPECVGCPQQGTNNLSQFEFRLALLKLLGN
jgi:hypothetical protein